MAVWSYFLLCPTFLEDATIVTLLNESPNITELKWVLDAIY